MWDVGCRKLDVQIGGWFSDLPRPTSHLLLPASYFPPLQDWDSHRLCNRVAQVIERHYLPVALDALQA